MGSQIKEGLLWFFLWLLLSILAALALFQIYSTILVAGAALNESRFRPIFWNFTRLKWLGRFLAFVLGTAFVFFISFSETMMRRWHKRKKLVPSSLRLAGWLLATSVISLVIAQLLIWIYPTAG